MSKLGKFLGSISNIGGLILGQGALSENEAAALSRQSAEAKATEKTPLGGRFQGGDKAGVRNALQAYFYSESVLEQMMKDLQTPEAARLGISPDEIPQYLQTVQFGQQKALQDLVQALNATMTRRDGGITLDGGGVFSDDEWEMIQQALPPELTQLFAQSDMRAMAMLELTEEYGEEAMANRFNPGANLPNDRRVEFLGHLSSMGGLRGDVAKNILSTMTPGKDEATAYLADNFPNLDLNANPSITIQQIVESFGDDSVALADWATHAMQAHPDRAASIATVAQAHLNAEDREALKATQEAMATAAVDLETATTAQTTYKEGLTAATKAIITACASGGTTSFQPTKLVQETSQDELGVASQEETLTSTLSTSAPRPGAIANCIMKEAADRGYSAEDMRHLIGDSGLIDSSDWMELDSLFTDFATNNGGLIWSPTANGGLSGGTIGEAATEAVDSQASHGQWSTAQLTHLNQMGDYFGDFQFEEALNLQGGNLPAFVTSMVAAGGSTATVGTIEAQLASLAAAVSQKEAAVLTAQTDLTFESQTGPVNLFGGNQ